LWSRSLATQDVQAFWQACLGLKPRAAQNLAASMRNNPAACIASAKSHA
jgi:hypothetical protein